MPGSRFRIAVAAGIALVSAIGITVAMAVNKPNVKGSLSGYQEVPAVSSEASGKFEAKVPKGGGPIRYELRYRGIPDVTQAHLHFAQKGVNGGIVVFICSDGAPPPPAGTPDCPEGSGTLTGNITSDDVTDGAETQGIAAGELNEVKRAIRAGVIYANVHSDVFPGGEIRAQLRMKK
jgi:CHRD domain